MGSACCSCLTGTGAGGGACNGERMLLMFDRYRGWGGGACNGERMLLMFDRYRGGHATLMPDC